MEAHAVTAMLTEKKSVFKDTLHKCYGNVIHLTNLKLGRRFWIVLLYALMIGMQLFMFQAQLILVLRYIRNASYVIADSCNAENCPSIGVTVLSIVHGQLWEWIAQWLDESYHLHFKA